ncbi:CYTH domain-containing protein [Bacillus massilinigeriensis]|uniref:CYTH domain-containing protein n=1 Tax=Bacillus mediterraneensis TaxID=1805474 RepID=UPI0008F8E8D4|nr:CYTH domain-containing protein [Bacillus mediterraneensis]
MSENIEIEFKNILLPEEFATLQSYFSINQEDFQTQVNHYFDTRDFHLKNSNSALRIRQKGNHMEITLKQPAEVGLLEINQDINSTELEQMLFSAIIPDGPVKDALLELLPSSGHLVCFGSLKTFRAEKHYNNGLIVLDYSTYLGHDDYELEYEVTDEREGAKNFRELLEKLHIPLRKTDNKIKRFYQRKFSNFQEE